MDFKMFCFCIDMKRDHHAYMCIRMDDFDTKFVEKKDYEKTDTDQQYSAKLYGNEMDTLKWSL